MPSLFSPPLFLSPPPPPPPIPHTTRVPNIQRDIFKAKVNHIALMPKIFQWLPISARIKSKLCSSQGSYSLSSSSLPPSFSAFFQPLTHTSSPSQAQCIIPLPPALPKWLQQHSGLRSAQTADQPPRRPPLKTELTYLYLPQRTKPTLSLIFAYLNIYSPSHPLLEWRPLKGRDSVLLSLYPPQRSSISGY